MYVYSTGDETMFSFFLVFGLLSLNECCQKLFFQEIKETILMERPIFEQKAITNDECRRVCRMYLECFSYNMIWDLEETGVGDCQIFSGFRRPNVSPSFGLQQNATHFCKYM